MDDVYLQATSVTYADFNVGSHIVTASGLSLEGEAKDNYSLPLNPLDLEYESASILAKELTATFDNAGDKTYDGNANVINNDFNFSLAGIVSVEDDVYLQASSVTYEDFNVGSHIVIASGLSLAGTNESNYILQDGILEITYSSASILARNITISTEDYYKNSGEADPTFVPIYDVNLLASGEVLSGSLLRYPEGEEPGYYDITEGSLDILRGSVSSKLNYIIDYTGLGQLYINPYGNEAKKIRTYTQCVEEKPDGNGYTVYFKYINDNPYRVYIPLGDNNTITGPGEVFNGLPPEWFDQGEHVFPIEFDGKKITWEVRNLDSWHKTSASKAANAGVGGCNNLEGARIADITVETSDALLEEDGLGLESGTVVIYPNPAKDKFNIAFSGNPEVMSEIELIDSQGKMLRLDASWNAYSNSLEVDVSKLNYGLYLIKLSINSEDRLYRFIKQ